MIYVGNQPSMGIVQSYADRWDFINSSDPTVTTNPSQANATWLNTTSGEQFVCIDNTADANVWKGQMGTTVS